MLSPNATNDVTDSRGGCCTVTLNVHWSVRCRESVATHVTIVVPTLKFDPLAGVQVVLIGGAPPVDVTVPYCTDTPALVGAVTADGGAGQVIFGPSGYGSTGVGFAGLAQLAAPMMAPTSSCSVNERVRRAFN
jgi:hypothetical protein